MIKKIISKKKQKLLDEKKNSPLEVGEQIYVYRNSINKLNKGGSDIYTICSLEDNKIEVYYGTGKKEPFTHTHFITENDISSRYLFEIGENPFSKDKLINCINFKFDSILFELGLCQTGDSFNEFKQGKFTIKKCNWNPFVYDKNGNKQYFQRPFVWKLKEKQLLIESIYQGIDCGKIVVRKRGWKELDMLEEKGETEFYWKEIIDGKQRLGAAVDFIECKFKDLNGNYFSDLSSEAQKEFTNHNLFSYAEMEEDSKDEDVLRQFLKLNVCGVPQSKEHIKFVKSLYEKI